MNPISKAKAIVLIIVQFFVSLFSFGSCGADPDEPIDFDEIVGERVADAEAWASAFDYGDISSATVRVYLDGEILSGGYTVKYDNGRIEENYEIAGISQDKRYTVIGENEIIEYRYDSETSEWKGYEKYISEFDYPDGFSIGADIRFHLSGVGPYDDIENHFDEITYSEEKNAYVLSRREKYTESDVTYYYTTYTYYKILNGMCVGVVAEAAPDSPDAPVPSGGDAQAWDDKLCFYLYNIGTTAVELPEGICI